MNSPPKKRTLDEAGRDSVLSRVAEFLRSRRPEILAAYAFGSFARGEAFADLDLAVFSERPSTMPLEFEMTLEVELEKLVRMPVDVRILNYAPQPFQYTVIREGVVVLDRDPNRRAAFEGNAIKQYLDFARFRRRSLKEISRSEI
jgi:hypothetical protein